MKSKMLLWGIPLFLIVGCSTVNVNVTQSGATAKTVAGKVSSFPHAVEVGLFKSPQDIEVTLDRIFKVVSNPSGAEVIYNGASLGTTPCSVVMNDLEGGKVVFQKSGYLSAEVKVTEDLPNELKVTLDRDGSGRRLLNLVPEQNGVRVKVTPIHSDLEVGESSPNVASVRRLTSQPQNEYIQNFSLLPDGKSITVSIVEEFLKEGFLNHRSNIWTLDASVSGAPRRAMTTGNYFDLTPNASSDGKTLFLPLRGMDV